MPLYRQKELHSFLQQIGASAKKSLSQNFLIDGNIVDAIVRVAQVNSHDTVLEIGPGPGVLTEKLVSTGCQLVAVEKDPLFARHLPRLGEAIRVIEGDFLEQSLETLLPPNTKVVANLPYSLTSPILEKLFFHGHLFERLVLMVQKEVAERIVSQPSSKQYGALTVFCRFFTDPEIAIRVKNSCFDPRPKVDSAVVVFKMKKEPIEIYRNALEKGLLGTNAPCEIDIQKFFRFVRTLFSFRRKMISNSLKRMYNEGALEALDKAGIKGQMRCENLSLDQFIALFASLP